jgi:hypothetical protein
MAMDRFPLNSTRLVGGGYDDESGTLELEFRTGQVYRYFDVPGEVVAELRSAGSPGRYFQQAIKNIYAFERVS